MKYQLLVRNPEEKLEIVWVEISGGYYDQSRILWDEREGDPFPSEFQAELDEDNSERAAALALAETKRQEKLTERGQLKGLINAVDADPSLSQLQKRLYKYLLENTI